MTTIADTSDHPEPVDPPREDVETPEVLLALMEESGFPATIAETDAKMSELLEKRYRTTLLARWNELDGQIKRLLDHRLGLTA